MGAHVNIGARTSIYWRATSIIRARPNIVVPRQNKDAMNEINAINTR